MGILCAGAGTFTNCVAEYSNPGIQGRIQIAGSANRAEGNALAYNVVGGLVVDDDRNFNAGNTVRGNSPNHVIVAGNRIARIVVPGVNAAAIAGANGGSADGYTAVDPGANFSY